ncbi:hypothetical protein D3C78_1493490 [compost metagenome]
MQAHAEAGQQVEADLRLFFQQAPVVGAVDADQVAGFQRAAGHGVVAGAGEQQGLGEALPGLDDFHQLFLALEQYAGQFHLAVEQQIEAVGGIALVEQRIAAVQLALDGQAADFREQGLGQPVEQVVLAQGLEVF